MVRFRIIAEAGIRRLGLIVNRRFAAPGRVAGRRLSWMVLAIAVASCTGSPTASLPEPAGPVTLLVDTDVAPDDLVAIAFLLAAPQVEIAAITVSGTGEAHCGPGVAIVLGLLERLEAPQIPVACGRERPMALDHAFPELFRHNADAAAELTLPSTTRTPANGDAVGLITDTLTALDSPIRVLTLGPLTNLADALQTDPELAADIESVYIMGGAVEVPGNVAGSPDAPTDNTTAEWNIYVDPTAAAIVLDAGLSISLVSLDGTNEIPVTPAFAQQVKEQAQGRGLRVLAELFELNPYMTDGSYYVWDATAAISAAGYHIGEYTPVRLRVDEAEGPTSGATQRVDGTPNASFLSSADATVVEALILGLLNAE
jgi:inosine-uridine nucleoside N-ribohydrolase